MKRNSETADAGISLDQLRRTFGSTVALNDINLHIPQGEFLALLGPSGCGKSTLLRIIAGLLPPTSGRVLIDENDVTALPPGQRDIAMVFQSYALYPHMSVERNLGFGLRVRHRAKEEIATKVTAVAEQLKLGDLLHRKPKELSGGQRQRVALGRAVIRDPKAFLMDEPLSNLDAQLRTATRLELTELHRRLASTFVYVTHDQVEAMTMATRIAVMNNGRIEQVGSPAEIYDEPATAFVATFVGAPPMNLVPARAAGFGGKVRAIAEGINIELWDGELEERDVLLGVRPEHLGFAPTDHGGPGLDGTVIAVENLGSEEVAFCDVGSAQIAVRGPRPLGVAAGDTVSLVAPPRRYYLYDPVSTRRLIWIEDGVPAADLAMAARSTSDA
jgi:multiple sugar transport system ATP-binding protein